MCIQSHVSDKCVCQRMLKLMQRGIAACFFAYLLAINQQSSNFTLATLVNMLKGL